MIRAWTFALGLGLAALVACGDSGTNEGGAGTGATGSGAGSTGGAATGGQGAGASGTGGAGTGGGAAGSVVINEIQGHHPEWIELANAGTEAIDLGDYALCDEDANGACELAGALRFPAGTTLAAKAYLVVTTDDMSGATGPDANGCPAGVASCYHAGWQIGATDGETIRVMSPSDQEVAAFTYPPNATADDTTSWSRVPDMTGQGQVTPTSPGAANQP